MLFCVVECRGRCDGHEEGTQKGKSIEHVGQCSLTKTADDDRDPEMRFAGLDPAYH